MNTERDRDGRLVVDGISMTGVDSDYAITKGEGEEQETIYLDFLVSHEYGTVAFRGTYENSIEIADLEYFEASTQRAMEEARMFCDRMLDHLNVGPDEPMTPDEYRDAGQAVATFLNALREEIG